MTKPRVSKLNVWLKHYLDETNPKTFMNKKESARAAGYKCSTDESFGSVGCQNFNKLKDKIVKWLDENSFSDNAIKAKIVSLMDATEIKLFQGEDEDGKFCVHEHEIKDCKTQLKAVNLATDVKGMKAAQKVDIAIDPRKILEMLPVELQAEIKKNLMELKKK